MARFLEFSFNFDFKQLVCNILTLSNPLNTDKIHTYSLLHTGFISAYILDIDLILDFSQFHPKLLYYRQKGHENCVIIRVPCPYSTWSCTIKARGLDFLLFVIPSSLAENEQRKPFPTAFC